MTDVYHKAPSRIFTVGQHETELMLALGLGDKIVGTSVWFGELPAQWQKEGAQLKRISDNSPAFEAVVGERPDFVAAQYSWHIGPKGEVATRQQFEPLGIHTWISPADCEGKAVTDTSNGDGARLTPFTVELLYKEITQLAEIFDVREKGTALKEQLASRIALAQQRSGKNASRSTPPEVVFWFSSARLNGDPWVAGNSGAPAWIASTLGIKNIIDTNQEWPAVSWEYIAKSDPDYIVVASMQRRLYPADDIAQKLAFLRSDAVTRQMKAVKNNHIIVVPAMSLNPSLRNVDAIEEISSKIAGFTAAK
ncbi:ABC transporter substrate-binding protein [Pseudomonas cerasi]